MWWVYHDSVPVGTDTIKTATTLIYRGDERIPDQTMYRPNTTGDTELAPTDVALTALAAKEGCDPVDIDTPLYQGVEPDAMDSVLGRENANHEVYVGFSLLGYGVQVHGDGTVFIDGERFDPETGSFESL